jgi:hypothetical protein
MGLVGVGSVGDWELEALKELHGARWDIRKVHGMTIIATPLYGGSPPLQAMSAAVLRVLIADADWQLARARFRPGG